MAVEVVVVVPCRLFFFTHHSIAVAAWFPFIVAAVLHRVIVTIVVNAAVVGI